MNSIRKFGVGLVVVVLVFGVSGATSLQDSSKFDEFGDINCEDEMARLDGFALTLQNAPANKGVIIFYGGRLFRGRLPKRSEAAARAARMRSYLVQRRGIPTEQVMMIDGGYMEKWTAVLWVVPSGANMPTPSPTVPAKQIKFRKGKPIPRDYNCQI